MNVLPNQWELFILQRILRLARNFHLAQLGVQGGGHAVVYRSLRSLMKNEKDENEKRFINVALLMVMYFTPQQEKRKGSGDENRDQEQPPRLICGLAERLFNGRREFDLIPLVGGKVG